MKKQLNIICVLIFLFVGLSILPSVFFMGKAFVDGFRYGMRMEMDSHMNKNAERICPLGLNLWPESFASTPNKMLNMKDQEQYPTLVIKAMVWVKSKDAGVMQFAGLLTIIGLFFILKAIVNFYKLINTINHGVIFDWVNVRRLNRVGKFLLISFALSQAYLLMAYFTARRLLELEGYRFNFWCDFESMNLILGLIALLVARIFAIGLQMKEEQELTI